MNLNRLFDDKASLASLFTAAALLAAFRFPTMMFRSVSYCIFTAVTSYGQRGSGSPLPSPPPPPRRKILKTDYSVYKKMFS